ncbi:LacI family DNA-binding transcriptional regulator [Elusimicrobiota bacterium]
MNRKVSIRDIAKEADVSISTVSRVVNGHEYIDEETRKKVQKVIDKYNYTPHFFGRALSKRTSESIGLITPLHFSPSSFYFTEIFKGIVDEAGSKDYSVIIPPYHSQDYLKLFIERRIDGAVFLAPPVDDQNIEVLAERELPFVLINSFINGAPRVDIDNTVAAKKMLSYLKELGHSDIAIITGYMKSPNARDRFNAYESFMKESGYAIKDGRVIIGDFQMEKAFNEIKKLFSSREDLPTAIFACNDSMAIGAIRAFKELDIRVPEKVSVAGFDDTDLSKLYSPSVTTIRQPFEEMGQAAGRLLIDILQGNAVEGEDIIVDTELVIRESTAHLKD